MDTTFITIHDLSSDARILYASDSIVDILGYSPEDVVNRTCWDYFHPDEIPLARATHEKSVELDKAAVLAYCRMRDSVGQWVGCEVIFTVVYDVLVGCTSVYRRGLRSDSRASEAPIVRRLFSSSPQDPRYHMLSHLSPKFNDPLTQDYHEPRAALFLNRYTRTLTIMYATDGLADLLGVTGEEMTGRSFYYCIQENCLKDSVKCLENAKSNDSIAYLRFWYRDIRQDDASAPAHSPASHSRPRPGAESEDEPMTDVGHREVDFPAEGQETPRQLGIPTGSSRNLSVSSSGMGPSGASESSDNAGLRGSRFERPPLPANDSGTTSGDSNTFTYDAVFGDSEPGQESSMSSSNSATPPRPRRVPSGQIELEAVVSCTSDGMVVCMRQARPTIPQVNRLRGGAGTGEGVFVAPWVNELDIPATNPAVAGVSPETTVQPVQDAQPPQPGQSMPQPTVHDTYMQTIREIGVFAWAIVGINGSLMQYSRGTPLGSSVPPGGAPIWERDNPPAD